MLTNVGGFFVFLFFLEQISTFSGTWYTVIDLLDVYLLVGKDCQKLLLSA